MINLSKILSLALILGGLSSCQTKDSASNFDIMADSTALKLINDSALILHIGQLASDEFEGRKPFTNGEVLTLNYLEKSFKEIGLEPGNGSSYFQEVPMVDVKSTPSAKMLIKAKNNELSFDHLDGFVAASRHLVSEVNVKDSKLVFAGYGIVAPEFGWNDYEGLDVKGKTVVVMINDPGFADKSLFKGETMTYYGRWTYKFEEAARQGATGVLIIHETAAASYPWAVVRSGWSKSKLFLEAPDENKSRSQIEGWITQENALKLFKLAGYDASLMDKAKQKGFKPVDLKASLSISVKNEIKRSVSKNVVAVLPGTKKADEYIIYSGHWDHLGTGEAVNGDRVYNGAIDNATGTAALLVLAKAFKHAEIAPERSIMFLAVTAEEQGLLGSEYYATNPIIPVQKTVANINVDAMHAFGLTKDIIAVGYGQSELEDYLIKAAKRQSREVVKDRNPSAGFYFRSDHFNFAKVGIPALYTETGEDHITKGVEFGRARKEAYNTSRYHAPGDNFDKENWDFTGMVADLRLLYEVGYKISRESKFPSWKEGSEFKAIREASLKLN